MGLIDWLKRIGKQKEGPILEEPAIKLEKTDEELRNKELEA